MRILVRGGEFAVQALITLLLMSSQLQQGICFVFLLVSMRCK